MVLVGPIRLRLAEVGGVLPDQLALVRMVQRPLAVHKAAAVVRMAVRPVAGLQAALEPTGVGMVAALARLRLERNMMARMVLVAVVAVRLFLVAVAWAVIMVPVAAVAVVRVERVVPGLMA